MNQNMTYRNARHWTDNINLEDLRRGLETNLQEMERKAREDIERRYQEDEERFLMAQDEQEYMNMNIPIHEDDQNIPIHEDELEFMEEDIWLKLRKRHKNLQLNCLHFHLHMLFLLGLYFLK